MKLHLTTASPNRFGHEPWREKYNSINETREGLAAVQKGYRWGFVNEQGVEVVPPKYDLVWDFNDGLAEVRLGGKVGFVDKTGKEVVPVKYDWVGDFHGGLAKVRSSRNYAYVYGYVDKKGNEIIEPRYNWITRTKKGFKARKNGLTFFIDKEGKEKLPSVIQNKDFQIISDSIGIVTEKTKKGGELKSIVNIKKDALLYGECKDAEILKNQTPPKRANLIQVKKDNLYGVYDTDEEKLIVPIKYTTVNGKLDEIFYICVSGKKVFIFDSKQQKEIPLEARFFDFSGNENINNIIKSETGWSTVDEYRNLAFFDPNFKPIKLWDKDYDSVKFVSPRYWYSERMIHGWWHARGHKYFYVVKNDKCGLYVTDLNDQGYPATPLIFDPVSSVGVKPALHNISRIFLKGFDGKDYWYSLHDGLFYTTNNGRIRAQIKEDRAPNLKIVKLHNRYGIEDTETKKIVLPAVYNLILVSSLENKLFETYVNGTPGKKDGIKTSFNKDELYEKGWEIKKSLKANPGAFIYLIQPSGNENESLTEKQEKDFIKWLNRNTQGVS